MVLVLLLLLRAVEEVVGNRLDRRDGSLSTISLSRVVARVSSLELELMRALVLQLLYR